MKLLRLKVNLLKFVPGTKIQKAITKRELRHLETILPLVKAGTKERVLKFFSVMRSVSRSVLTSNLLPFFSVSH